MKVSGFSHAIHVVHTAREVIKPHHVRAGLYSVAVSTSLVYDSVRGGIDLVSGAVSVCANFLKSIGG